MAFCFSAGRRSISKSLRSLALNRLDASLSLLDGDDLPAPETIHELRKNIKKLRGLLRLYRGSFPGFAAENLALRDAGRLLSPLREGSVLLATFDSLDCPDPDLRARLAATVAVHDANAPEALAAYRRAIGAVRDRVAHWRCKGKGFDAIAPGLARTWTDARQGMHRALAHPRGEALHDWRKRVKDHGYHAHLLEPVWPQMMGAHAAVADRLGDILGEARDLALLAEAVETLGGGAVLAPAREAEERHLAEARMVARRLFAEPADALVDRWQRWWTIWRSDQSGG